MYRLAALSGLACFALIALGGLLSRTVPEWVGQLVWLGLVITLAARCGYRDPSLGWRAGAAMMLVHVIGFWVLMVVTGELIHPSSSTGGMVTLFIGTLFMAFVSPIPLLASQLGSTAQAARCPCAVCNWSLPVMLAA